MILGILVQEENKNRNNSVDVDSHLNTQFHQIWRVPKQSRKSVKWHQEQGTAFSTLAFGNKFSLCTNGCGYSNLLNDIKNKALTFQVLLYSR